MPPKVENPGQETGDPKQGPEPVEIDLTDGYGFSKREEAHAFVEATKAKGIEAGNVYEQATGRLAQGVVLDLLPGAKDAGDELGHDIDLPSGVKLDVKCRGGEFPFQLFYERRGGKSPREAKHNFFARQLFDDEERYDADAYVLCHLLRPKPPKGSPLFPGTKRQKKWRLFICGWASAKRAKKGVFLPRGALTEQGSSWFPYRAFEVEFYQRNLASVWVDGRGSLRPICDLTADAVREDETRSVGLHLTTTDLSRIVADLRGLGVVSGVPSGILEPWEPILHPNQYWHVARWIEAAGTSVDAEALKRAVGPEVSYAEAAPPKKKDKKPDPDA